MEHKENAGKRRLIFLNTKIASNGEDMKAMVDTGSEISIVHVQHVANLKYNFQNRSRIVSASGHSGYARISGTKAKNNES